jgi:FkbM family methyltransferase
MAKHDVRSDVLETEGFNGLARVREGYYLYNRNDQYIGRAIAKYGEFSALEMQLLRQLCAPGDVVIEVGANIGAHTVELARHVGRNGHVLAFEPQRLVFQALCANIALNSLENVDCYWAALGTRNGVVIVPEADPRQPYNFGGVTLLGAQQGQPVDCYTLDRFITLPRLRLIKIDVEGMEADVLGGGRGLIQKFRPFLYVENDRVEKSEALISMINDLGYRMFWHLPPLFNPDNYYAETENAYPNIISINMICVPRESGINIKGFTEITDFFLHPLRR